MQSEILDAAHLLRLVQIFDVLAAIVFAASGALVAARKGMDIVGFMWLAVITGVGGGTVRDVILDVPVFWVQRPGPVITCLITAVVMHFVAPLVESRRRILDWFDAVGLAFVTIAGTAKALDAGVPAIVAIAMGVVTGVVGGIIRDLIGQVPSIILRREIYVTASMLGACTFAALNAADLPRLATMSAGFAVTFVVRALAIAFGWSLPVFRGQQELDTKARRHEDTHEG